MYLDGLKEEAVEATAVEGSDSAAGEGPAPPGMGPLPKEDGTLVYRYVPAVGKPGEADAEYAVLVREGATTPPRVEKRRRSAEARLEFSPGTWDSLPTLHHIASALAEMPIYGVVEAKVEEGHGVDDLSSAQRIE
ncbi:7a670087-64cf-4642-92ed-d5e6b981557a [Thermothielavioides terrestris]|uniref:7a670087-64cf-4642-92ed-d5e6b981557a n=1 Tax=Thermothielavioides terrestris TaxID=2587410 RepID=A0A3S4D8F4_9PEZI|nr:7a670087-64cf-4642-92ed-d5e6b981557a [Thermothielavioides terrestris]